MKKKKKMVGFHLYDIYKFVKLFHNLSQNPFSPRDNYGDESLVLIQTHSRGFDIVAQPSKYAGNPVNYCTFITNKHRNCVLFQPESNEMWVKTKVSIRNMHLQWSKKIRRYNVPRMPKSKIFQENSLITLA